MFWLESIVKIVIVYSYKKNHSFFSFSVLF